MYQWENIIYSHEECIFDVSSSPVLLRNMSNVQEIHWLGPNLTLFLKQQKSRVATTRLFQKGGEEN